MVEIVAEISGNHGGLKSKMLSMIWEASVCGCNYAKFQYYRPEDMPDVDEGSNWDMYERLRVPSYWLPDMFECAKSNSIGLVASVFSVRAAQEMLEYDSPFVKIASMDSTPLSKDTFIDIVMEVHNKRDLVYSLDADLSFPHGLATTGFQLVCPPGHPPSPTSIWETLRRFDPEYHHGFSDHTPGIETPLRFIRRGAKMIEKHFKLWEDKDCVDGHFSADPRTMTTLCRLAHNKQ